MINDNNVNHQSLFMINDVQQYWIFNSNPDIYTLCFSDSVSFIYQNMWKVGHWTIVTQSDFSGSWLSGGNLKLLSHINILEYYNGKYVERYPNIQIFITHLSKWLLRDLASWWQYPLSSLPSITGCQQRHPLQYQVLVEYFQVFISTFIFHICNTKC